MFLGFTLDELVEVVRTCESITIDDCVPDYLQHFISRRLDASYPVLAKRVLLLDGDQMDALCEYIKDTHFLIRQP